MVFACQKDSFLKEFTTTVVSCKDSKKIKWRNPTNGKEELIEAFEVVLEDTILFPEGGGQPYDLGTINGKEVLQVLRRGAEAVHFVKEYFDSGLNVTLKLDWDRRLDHMQQHSGQHLLSAVIEAELGYATLSWWLGEDISYVELDTPSMSSDQISRMESLLNQYIREGRSVTVKVYEASDPELTKAHTRGLPEDHVGLVRMINIENLDNNMCCGTHVSNLSQLQMIKLTGVEKGKKGKTKLNFLVGNRVLKTLNELLLREASLTNLLQNKGSMHVELTQKIQESLKTAVKNLRTVLQEVATEEARKLKSSLPSHYILHKKEADMDFANTFLREFNDESVLLLLIVGDEPNLQIILYGKPDIISSVGPKICSEMGGKGFGKGTRFQAKVTKLKLKEVTSIVEAAVQGTTLV